MGKLTRLDLLGKRPGERRRELYAQARDLLLAAGYQQISMRLFRTGAAGVSEYTCQEDGMVGLGPGARSYTRELHYSTEYAVGPQGVRAIIEGFDRREAPQFGTADYGVRLDADEQRVRFLLKSLLRAEGIVLGAYETRFGTALASDFPQLNQLHELGLVEGDGQQLRLNAEGLAWTDTIGPWLYSEAMNARMAAYELA